jgi:hypothetical protein
MKIFRGESLKDAELIPDTQKREARMKRIGDVKACVSRYFYPSKMLNGGDPYRVVKLGLLKNIVEHILEVYTDLSHLLSFSSDESIARHFGTVRGQVSTDAVESGYSIGGSDTEWILENTEYLVVEIDIEKRVEVSGQKGIYILTYADGKRLLLINSLEFLLANEETAKNLPGFAEAKCFAETEREWLVLPADRCQQLGVPDSLSAVIAIFNDTIDVKAYVSPVKM